MTQHCSRYAEYLREELRQMAEAIQLERQRMSEAAGVDVGYDAAKRSFLSEHLDEFARAFHVDYCGELCPDRMACGTWQAWCRKQHRS